MASAAHDPDEMITSINVTPLVDITLVLLIILMITASYVASKAIPLDLPKGATAETTPVTLSVSIDKDGKTYLEAAPIDDAGLRDKVRAARAADPEARAVIAADGRAAHKHVARAPVAARASSRTRAASLPPSSVATTVERRALANSSTWLRTEATESRTRSARTRTSPATIANRRPRPPAAEASSAALSDSRWVSCAMFNVQDSRKPAVRSRVGKAAFLTLGGIGM